MIAAGSIAYRTMTAWPDAVQTTEFGSSTGDLELTFTVLELDLANLYLTGQPGSRLEGDVLLRTDLYPFNLSFAADTDDCDWRLKEHQDGDAFEVTQLNQDWNCIQAFNTMDMNGFTITSMKDQRSTFTAADSDPGTTWS